MLPSDVFLYELRLAEQAERLRLAAHRYRVELALRGGRVERAERRPGRRRVLALVGLLLARPAQNR
jgi:hypothetical protein